jgi:acetyl esterase/lipase
MAEYPLARRDFLKLSVGVAAAFSALGPAARRAAAAAASAAAPAYDPGATFEIDVTEVEVRRNQAGRMLMARVYRPKGAGPFPVVLDLHGGAWNNKSRTAEEPMDRAIAASGVLVVAIDLTLAPEAAYPASVQDANYGVRWLKWKAAGWNGDASRLGIYGSSSGGHVAQLLAMRPHDPRYNAVPLPEAARLDATVAVVAMRSPISDPFARYQNAVKHQRDSMITSHKTYFVPWEAIHEANPQEMLERREKVTLVPMLLMQGALDDNVLPAVQEKFAATYRAAGGHCQLEIFAGSEHEWVAKPGPQTDRARAMVKAFIAEQLQQPTRR